MLKGVQHEQDMREAADIGVDGIIVSNHGGRQLDAAPTSVQSLRAVTTQLRERMTIMVDSGIRTGMDVVRARGTRGFDDFYRARLLLGSRRPRKARREIRWWKFFATKSNEP